METRYGKGKDLPETVLAGFDLEESPKLITRVYTKGDYTITASYLHGKTGREDYTRKDGRELTNEEIQTILNLNNLGSKWQETDSGVSDRKEWKLKNGGASAGYWLKTLYFMTKEYSKTYPENHHTR